MINARQRGHREETEMAIYHPDLLATPVPRYTSYPTAAEFHDGVASPEQRTGLLSITASEPISLYLHIPYCREICWYCGCNTGRANRSQRLANYLDNLNREIRMVGELLSGRGRVERVAFGGGSPNAISADQFRSLIGGIRETFPGATDATWSVEIDPRGFEEDYAAVIAESGFARASLGVQTFDPTIQAAIGRVQPASTIDRAIALLRAAGVSSLNVDLMYGLPGQSSSQLLDSIGLALDAGADRMAVFGYAHVPDLIARQRRIDGSALPDARQRFAQAEEARSMLMGRGWTAVGFDHFARRGDPLANAAESNRVRRNFQGFTDDPCDTLIGLGASAISRFQNALVQNEHNAGRYGMRIAGGQLAGARGVATPRAERRRARMIEQLLSNGATNIGELSTDPSVRERLAPYLERGLATQRGMWLELAEDAAPYSRGIAAILDPWRAGSKRTFSSAV